MRAARAARNCKPTPRRARVATSHNALPAIAEYLQVEHARFNFTLNRVVLRVFRTSAARGFWTSFALAQSSHSTFCSKYEQVLSGLALIELRHSDTAQVWRSQRDTNTGTSVWTCPSSTWALRTR